MGCARSGQKQKWNGENCFINIPVSQYRVAEKTIFSIILDKIAKSQTKTQQQRENSNDIKIKKKKRKRHFSIKVQQNVSRNDKNIQDQATSKQNATTKNSQNLQNTMIGLLKPCQPILPVVYLHNNSIQNQQTLKNKINREQTNLRQKDRRNSIQKVDGLIYGKQNKEKQRNMIDQGINNLQQDVIQQVQMIDDMTDNKIKYKIDDQIEDNKDDKIDNNIEDDNKKQNYQANNKEQQNKMQIIMLDEQQYM